MIVCCQEHAEALLYHGGHHPGHHPGVCSSTSLLLCHGRDDEGLGHQQPGEAGPDQSAQQPSPACPLPLILMSWTRNIR